MSQVRPVSNPKRAKDTRSRSLLEPIVQVGTEGHKSVELNHLNPQQRLKLAQGMKATEAGRNHFEVMQEARKNLGPLMDLEGTTFRMTRPQYIKYMKDAEESVKEGETE